MGVVRYACMPWCARGDTEDSYGSWFSPPCRSWEINLGHETLQQVPSPAEPPKGLVLYGCFAPEVSHIFEEYTRTKRVLDILV